MTCTRSRCACLGFRARVHGHGLVLGLALLDLWPTRYWTEANACTMTRAIMRCCGPLHSSEHELGWQRMLACMEASIARDTRIYAVRDDKTEDCLLWVPQAAQ